MEQLWNRECATRCKRSPRRTSESGLHADHPADPFLVQFDGARFEPDALTEPLGLDCLRATRRAGTLKSRTISKANRGQIPRLRFARPVRPLLVTRSVLALDDVVDLEHLGLARKLDPDVLKHWHEALTERVELLARVPDLADSEVTVRLEGDVILEALRQPVARLLEAADGFVVLFGSHTGRGREAGTKARLASVHDRCGGRIGGGH